MKAKYKKRIQNFAEISLSKKLDKKINSYIENYSAYKVHEFIPESVSQAIEDDEERMNGMDDLGGKLQVLGKEIADNLLDTFFIKSIPFIDMEIKKRKKILRKEIFLIENLDNEFSLLKDKIECNLIRKSQFWGGADVIIMPNARSVNPNYSNDIHVVTGTEILAGMLSRLFLNLRDALSPFIDFRNKYKFYGDLANAANEVLQTENHTDKDVLNAVLNQAKEFATKDLPYLQEYFENKEKELQEASALLLGN